MHLKAQQRPHLQHTQTLTGTHHHKEKHTRTDNFQKGAPTKAPTRNKDKKPRRASENRQGDSRVTLREKQKSKEHQGWHKSTNSPPRESRSRRPPADHPQTRRTGNGQDGSEQEGPQPETHRSQRQAQSKPHRRGRTNPKIHGDGNVTTTRWSKERSPGNKGTGRWPRTRRNKIYTRTLTTEEQQELDIVLSQYDTGQHGTHSWGVQGEITTTHSSTRVRNNRRGKA